MMNRSRWAAFAAATLSLAACGSLQSQPAVSSSPAAFESQSVDITTLTPNPDPAGSTLTATPAPTAPPAPKPRQVSYNSIDTPEKVTAITFDDGPHPKLTPKLLDMLKERGIKATFFLVGQNAEEYPEIVKRMVSEGHEVANHSWSHPSLTSLGSAGVRSQIERTNGAIEKAVGIRPTLLRPPYGATSARLNRYFADEFGMTVVLWSVDPLDWKYRNSSTVTRKILEGTAPGAIILVHDIHATSVAAMPGVLDELTARGYKFLTVSELIAKESQPVATMTAIEEPTPKPAEPVSLPTDFEVNRYDEETGG